MNVSYSSAIKKQCMYIVSSCLLACQVNLHEHVKEFRLQHQLTVYTVIFVFVIQIESRSTHFTMWVRIWIRIQIGIWITTVYTTHQCGFNLDSIWIGVSCKHVIYIGQLNGCNGWQSTCTNMQCKEATLQHSTTHNHPIQRMDVEIVPTIAIVCYLSLQGS